MQSKLIEKLRAFILIHNPELAAKLHEDYSMNQYLEDKVMAVMPLLEQLHAAGSPQYSIEELCLNAMTQDLRPSRYQYIREVMETEFPEEYRQLSNKGVLTFETIQILELCHSVFEIYGFSEETKDSRFLRYAVIVVLHQHFN
ncbi:hypothetical protein D3C87_298650 [compost metagenome]